VLGILNFKLNIGGSEDIKFMQIYGLIIKWCLQTVK